jgi:hypothetical protein
MTGARCRLTGGLRVALPPSEAFRLFTPLGEREWADGWNPRFPAPAEDDTMPGTVFETSAHGHRTVWLVVDREPGRRISYARVTPGRDAGTVSVELGDAGDTASQVTVTYELTTLTDAGRHWLHAFTEGYPAYLRSWEEAIAATVTR